MNLNTIAFVLFLAIGGFGYLALSTGSVTAAVLTMLCLLGLSSCMAVASVRSPFMQRRLTRND